MNLLMAYAVFITIGFAIAIWIAALFNKAYKEICNRNVWEIPHD